MDGDRREKSRKAVEKDRNKQERQTESQVKFVEDFGKFIETQKKKTGMSEDKLINEVLSSHVSMFEFDETTGKASLVFDAWKGVAVGEATKVSQATLNDFRDLRENFAPVSAGIEWHRDFTCYDDQTEILTENGWKLFKDLTDEEKVATLNPETNDLEYKLPYKRMIYDYEGILWEFKNQQIDLVVTPNHKILMRIVGRDRFKKPFKLVEVKDAVKYQKIEMKKDAKWNCVNQELFMLPETSKTTSDKIFPNFNMCDWLEFFGYYITEGSVQRKSTGYVVKISQSKKAHLDIYNKIENCIQRLGYNYYANENYFTIWNKQLYLYLKQFGRSWQKYIPIEIKRLPPQKLKILYDAMIDGDGVRYENTSGFVSTSKRLIDDMQEIMLKLGFAGNVKLHNSMEQSNINGRIITPKHQCYRIFEIDYKGLTPIILRKNVKEVQYKGKIYSCEVQNHILYVRRNGIPIWSGNSGGGFLVQIDDPTDKNQNVMREEINLFNRNVFQDQYVKGLDNILDIEIDIALTDGCAAAEIVYQKEVAFEDYVDEIEEVVLDDGKKVKVIKPKEMTSELWKDLGGITRLKIIEDTYSRLVPYRHPKSGEILYWTLDEKGSNVNQGLSYEDIVNKEKKKTVIKFYPWEILWLSWNQRGTNLKGMSMIQPVYKIAKMVQEIQTSVGKGFNRWANKKYFFVCGSERRQWNKVYRTEFLKAMEKMIKNNWVGIPVPAEFEIREIGGEQSVFDGKNILDHLIGMIAAGMQYPREFLEVGRTQASDKAWLAWTVRYGRSQLQIRRAIEHQLWERHLWCKFGMTKKKSVKGVSKEEQEDIPIYVPKLQWKAEGQWLKDAKIKLLTGLLNVANPIDYPLKMPVQKEMGATIGIGEIDWKDIEELFDVQNKIKIATAKMEQMKAEAKLGEMEKMSEEELIKLVTPAPTPPTPQTSEEKLQEQERKRTEAGVSRTTKETGTQTKKGQAKEMGGTRLTETVEQLELPQDILDGIKKLVNARLRKQEMENETSEIVLENAKKMSEVAKVESEVAQKNTELTEMELKIIREKTEVEKELAKMEKENTEKKKELTEIELEGAKQKKKQRDDLDEEIRKVKKK